MFSALVSLEAGRSFSALLSEASVFDSVFDSAFDSLCEALADSALDSAFDSLVDADALEAELEECSELLPEVLWDELELPEEAASAGYKALYETEVQKVEALKAEMREIIGRMQNIVK